MIDNAEDLDIVMSMYDLLEYCQNYSMTSRILWNYYRDEIDDVDFWRFLDLQLIKCEIELDLSWTKDCVLIEHHNNMAGVNFMITSTKLHVSVVTLSIIGNTKF